VINKLLYHATAAFDRVLAGLSIISCQQMGLPYIAGAFMFHLLQQMSFHLMTGFSQSASTFSNNDNLALPGQGVLQGRSLAAPIYIFHSDISLSTYCKLSAGASFIHPISRKKFTNKVIQYVDDTTQ
jgi:hypothetical protein